MAITWQPGHYIRVGDAAVTDDNHLSTLQRTWTDYPLLKGGFIPLVWKQFEPTDGNYTFSKALSILDALEAQGKYGMIVPYDKSFHGASYTWFMPNYILNDPAYGHSNTAPAGVYGVAASNNGYIQRFWDSAVMNRWIAMMQAMGTALDGHGALAGVYLNSGESALGFGTPGTPTDFDKADATIQYKRRVTQVVGYFPETPCFLGINHPVDNVGDADFSDVISTLYSSGAGQAEPDYRDEWSELYSSGNNDRTPAQLTYQASYIGKTPRSVIFSFSAMDNYTEAAAAGHPYPGSYNGFQSITDWLYTYGYNFCFWIPPALDAGGYQAIANLPNTVLTTVPENLDTGTAPVIATSDSGYSIATTATGTHELSTLGGAAVTANDQRPGGELIDAATVSSSPAGLLAKTTDGLDLELDMDELDSSYGTDWTGTIIGSYNLIDATGGAATVSINVTGSSGGTSSIDMQDDLDDTNGTEIEDHTIDPTQVSAVANWSIPTGNDGVTGQINSNALTMNPYSRIWYDMGSSDGEFSFDFDAGTTNQRISVIIDSDDTGAALSPVSAVDVAIQPDAGNVRIYDWSSSSRGAALNTDSITTNASSGSVTWKIRLDNNNITIKENGTTVSTYAYTGSNLAGTGHWGLKRFDTTATDDNVINNISFTTFSTAATPSAAVAYDFADTQNIERGDADVVLPIGQPYLVSAMSGSSPATVTAVGHTFENDDVVQVADGGGATNMDGNSYTVANVAGNDFDLVGADSTGYTSGGTVCLAGTLLQNCTIGGSDTTISLASVSAPTNNTTVLFSGGVLTVTVTNDAVSTSGTGSASFTFAISGNAGGASSAVASYDFGNDAPAPVNGSTLTVGAGSTATIVLNTGETIPPIAKLSPASALVTDANGDDGVFSTKTAPTHGTMVVSPDGKQATYTHDGLSATYPQADSWEFYVSDGDLSSNPTYGTLTISAVRPNAVDDTFEISELNIPTVLNVLANDEDGVGSGLTIVDIDGGGTTSVATTYGVASVTGTAPNEVITYTATAIGVDSFTYTTADGNTDQSTATVTTLNLVNITTRDVAVAGFSAGFTMSIDLSDFVTVVPTTALTYAYDGTATGTVSIVGSVLTYTSADGAADTIIVDVSPTAGTAEPIPLRIDIGAYQSPSVERMTTPVSGRSKIVSAESRTVEV